MDGEKGDRSENASGGRSIAGASPAHSLYWRSREGVPACTGSWNESFPPRLTGSSLEPISLVLV
jgi:hypothetical protein